jgi:hypothetical protein
MIDFVQREKS